MADRDPITQPGPTAGGSETTPAADSAGTDEGPSTATAPEATSDTPATAGTEDTFYDPKTAPPELQGEYKKMQAAFTKKMQALSKGKDKIAAYEQFEKDPVGQLQRLAQQYGMRLTPAQAQAAIDQQAGTQDLSNWTPNSWAEVINRTKAETQREILSQLSPLLKEVHAMKQSTIERQLSEIDPTWQQYEDTMVDNLKHHPTLAQDPALLYRMSVPPEAVESRAVQKALKRLEDKGKAAAASGSSTTSKKPSAALRQATTVQEAAEIARAKLAEDGLHPPNRR